MKRIAKPSAYSPDPTVQAPPCVWVVMGPEHGSGPAVVVGSVVLVLFVVALMLELIR